MCVSLMRSAAVVAGVLGGIFGPSQSTPASSA
jgi:hypothetical protein